MFYAFSSPVFQHQLFPALCFVAAGVFFILAVLEPFNWRRSMFTALHFAANICVLTSDPAQLQPWPDLVVPFTIGLLFHTTATLLVHKQSIDRRSSSASHRLGLALAAWVNITRRPAPAVINAGKTSPDSLLLPNPPSRTKDALGRAGRCAQLWLARIAVTALADRVVLSLGITILDFRPAMQSPMPRIGTLTANSVILRALFSLYWIWNTYFHLQVGYDVVATVFICVLRLNEPHEWPALFGSCFEAYSLRRFWGIFWHGLHVAPFLAFMPSLPAQYKRYGKVLRPLWIFILSAGCHAAANWSTTRRNSLREELRFFLYNWLTCTLEVAVSRTHFFKAAEEVRAENRPAEVSAPARLSRPARMLGFIWVWLFFFCTVPGWQYPAIYQAVVQ